MTKNKNPHTVLVNQLHEALKARPEFCFVWKNNSGSALIGKRYVSFGLKGSPDLIGFTKDGIFIGFEIKTGEARQTFEQRQFLERCRTFGARYYIVRDLSEILATLDKLEPTL